MQPNLFRVRRLALSSRRSAAPAAARRGLHRLLRVYTAAVARSPSVAAVLRGDLRHRHRRSRSRSAASIAATRSPPTVCRPTWRRPWSRSRTGGSSSIAGSTRAASCAPPSQCIGAEHRGRQHDHPAAGAADLSVARALAAPQGAGSDAGAFGSKSRLSKQEILARYLNAVYFGAGAFGADAAAQALFREEGGRSRSSPKRRCWPG